MKPKPVWYKGSSTEYAISVTITRIKKQKVAKFYNSPIRNFPT